MSFGGRIFFKNVLDAFYLLKFKYDPANGLLLWYDYLKEHDYFSTMKPFQIINRIPNMNILCRKASMIILLIRMQNVFPSIYNFFPRSYVLPYQVKKFIESFDRRFIIKPDCGSLGKGICVIDPNQEIPEIHGLSVAQEYLNSFLISQTKFDLRVYVLVLSIDPLEIYVYRDGIARFCSQKVNEDNIYSQLTNTAINHPVDSSVTKTIKNVFETMKQDGINTDLIWKKIDNIAVLTILSSYPYLKDGINNTFKSKNYNKCFQILGFDILIDEQLEPHLIEVNYRPFLTTYSFPEWMVKVGMIASTISLSFPYKNMQKYISNIKDMNEEEWENYYSKHIQDNIKEKIIERKSNDHFYGYRRVFPSRNKNNQKIYELVKYFAEKMPCSTSHSLPKLLKPIKNPKVGKISF